MQIFLKILGQKSLTLNIQPEITINDLKKITKSKVNNDLDHEGMRIVYCGKQLGFGTLKDYKIDNYSTLELLPPILGGGKKRKRKTYNTPKRVPHKRKRVKLQVLDYYDVNPDGTVVPNRTECTSPTCGPAVFMAFHQKGTKTPRYYCGKCHSTFIKK